MHLADAFIPSILHHVLVQLIQARS